MSYAIEITDLKKKYGNHEVLKGINFCVEHGEVFGILVSMEQVKQLFLNVSKAFVNIILVI